MGNSPSSFEKASAANEQEESHGNSVWAEVSHISDRDVLVRDIGGKRKQKVKLNDGRKKLKFTNVHLADRNRLDGLHEEKHQDKSSQTDCRSNERQGGGLTASSLAMGRSNEGFSNADLYRQDNCGHERKQESQGSRFQALLGKPRGEQRVMQGDARAYERARQGNRLPVQFAYNHRGTTSTTISARDVPVNRQMPRCE